MPIQASSATLFNWLRSFNSCRSNHSLVAILIEVKSCSRRQRGRVNHQARVKVFYCNQSIQALKEWLSNRRDLRLLRLTFKALEWRRPPTLMSLPCIFEILLSPAAGLPRRVEVASAAKGIRLIKLLAWVAFILWGKIIMQARLEAGINQIWALNQLRKISSSKRSISLDLEFRMTHRWHSSNRHQARWQARRMRQEERGSRMRW